MNAKGLSMFGKGMMLTILKCMLQVHWALKQAGMLLHLDARES